MSGGTTGKVFDILRMLNILQGGHHGPVRRWHKGYFATLLRRVITRFPSDAFNTWEMSGCTTGEVFDILRMLNILQGRQDAKYSPTLTTQGLSNDGI